MAEPQFPVATDDFFNRDIKPLRNTYGLTSRESSYITAYENQELQPQLEVMMKLRSQLMRERNSELAYQSSLFELEEKKRKSQEEINFGERTEEITKSLNNIIDDPTKNNFQKQREIASFGMKNANILSKFPAASIIFKSAEASLKSRQAESDSADKNLQTTSRLATAGIDPVKFDNHINSDGIVSDAEAMEREINQANWSKGQAIAGSRAATANQARLETENKALDDTFNRNLKELTGIEAFIKQVDEDTTVSQDIDENTKADVLASKKAGILKTIRLSDGTTLGDLGVTDVTSAFQIIANRKADVFQTRAAPEKARQQNIETTDERGAGSSMNRKPTVTLPDGITPDQLQQLQQLLESFNSQ